jgi:hypothetical protein
MEFITRIYRWFAERPQRALPYVFVIVGLGLLAKELLPLYFAIPPLPTGQLQLVSVTLDGARYVVAQDRMERGGKLRATVLIVFEKPIQAEGVSVRYETKREWIDCAKQEMELEGAGFYNDRGEQVLTRYFDRKPEKPKLIDKHVAYVCQGEKFPVSPVIGYQAALTQSAAVRAELIAQQ